jgi:hypothetical protein
MVPDPDAMSPMYSVFVALTLSFVVFAALLPLALDCIFSIIGLFRRDKCE